MSMFTRKVIRGNVKTVAQSFTYRNASKAIINQYNNNM